MSPKPGQPIGETFSHEESEKFKRELVESAKDQQPMTIMSSTDAYIAERMKSQPKSLAEIEVEVLDSDTKKGIHRLSLPEYFEPLSFDCTRGQSCSFHGWVKKEVNYGLEVKMDRWEQTKHGKYIFRWLNRNPKALDFSLNVRGWNLVNRSYFSDAPKILFSVSGGVQNGDSILGFMSIKKALQIRNKPSQDSLDRINSSNESKYESHPNFYKAKLGPDKDGEDFAPSDALQEGRDFNT